MTSPRNWPPIGWFLFWLIALSAPVDVLSVHVGATPPMLSRISMWCPGLAALITTFQCRLPFDALGLQAPRRRFWVMGYLLPWLYAIPVYVLVWLFMPGGFDWPAYVVTQAGTYRITSHPGLFSGLFGVSTTLTFGVLSTVVWTLGEELGWRGFLSPRLAENVGTTKAGLIVGVIWAVWHYPILLGADYNAGTAPAYAVTCFTIMVVAMGVVLSWLRTVSDSVWPCVLVHASHNILVQGVLDAMTARSGRAVYVTTEFGWGMALTLSVLAGVIAVQGHRRGGLMSSVSRPDGIA